MRRWSAVAATVGAAAVAAVMITTPAPAATSPAWLDHLKDATRAYQTVKVAKADGYGKFKDADGIACIDMPGMGGMGVHYADGSRVDGRIQLRHPEALVYRFTRNGHLKLAALEYLVTVGAWRANHPTGRPELFGHRFNRTPDGNRFGLPAFFSLHAWVWYDNPAGTFQMFNPRVHCPAGI
jgi:hypothetical protein